MNLVNAELKKRPVVAKKALKKSTTPTMSRKDDSKNADSLAPFMSPKIHRLLSYSAKAKNTLGQLSWPFQDSTVQRKIKVGKPNDKYEQEADRVANRVMRTRTKVASLDI